MGVEPDGAYGDPARVREELEWAKALYAQHPQWTVLDISGKAIEETAALILEKYRQRFEASGNGKLGAAARAEARSKGVFGKPIAAQKPAPAAKPTGTAKGGLKAKG